MMIAALGNAEALSILLEAGGDVNHMNVVSICIQILIYEQNS